MATVAPLPQLLNDAPNMQDPSALARKRRREIIQSQRAAVVPVPDVPVSASSSVLSNGEAARKKPKTCASAEAITVTNQQREVSIKTSTTSSAKPASKNTSKKATKKSGAAKKPQMKYDPDVPMTKEEAAVWRREQRRKRNRESAAASRQRQRDRIAELEVERDEWKKNFEQVMLKLHQLEEETGISSSASDLPIQTTSMSTAELEKTIVSPSSSPEVSPRPSPSCSPIASCSLLDTGRILEEVPGQEHHIFEKEEEKQLLNKMISRPAVKITGDDSLPPFPEDSLMVPDSALSDPCLSSEIKLAPLNDLSVPMEIKHQSEPSLLTDEENADELGEFLLDAVQWL